MKSLPLKRILLLPVAVCICLSSCNSRVTIKNPLNIRMGDPYSSHLDLNEDWLTL